MLDITYAYSCSGDPAVGGPARMEAHTQFGAATCCINMQVGLVPTVATSLQQNSLFTHS